MATRHDPVTGDALSTGEYVSWRVQGIIRNWWFLGLFTAITILVMALGNHNAHDWWNYTASYLAIVVESIVGIAMFNQTRRDAVILRHIERLIQMNEQSTELLMAKLDGKTCKPL